VPQLAPRPSPREAPPYARYAFWNPYNLSLLAGVTATSAATGHWWLGLCAGAAEAIWMLFAPDSPVLRRLWFDRLWAEEKKAAHQLRQTQLFNLLPLPEQQRVYALGELYKRIHQLAEQNPSFTLDLLRNDLQKLDGLVDDFLEMAHTCSRYEQHLRTIDVGYLEQQLRYYSEQIQQYPPGDERRSVAQNNLNVSLQRKDRYGELNRHLQTARGQMDLLENTFRLLADDIVTMHNPAELSDRLDDLRAGVEAVRETSRDTDQLLQTVAQR
jgi:hypothetical protein